MKFKNIKFYSYLFILISFTFFFFSCQSVKIPKTVYSSIDYTNEDVVRTEIDRINSMLSTEPVRGLWRAKLLNRDDVTETAVNKIQTLLAEAIENKDYSLARKYYISLKNVGFNADEYFDLDIEKLFYNDVPGNSIQNKTAPKSISDCMDGTVTVWVDRGIKIRNGAGYADVILGSGFFIDDRGYIITNHHVIESVVDTKYEGYVRLYIKMLDDPETKIPAKVVGYDPLLDLALLKAEVTPKITFNLGSSADLTIGDKISVIGTPVGLEGTLTSGIVSSFDRKLLMLGNVFQIDAAVNSGNSGGPLIDERMNVQAVVFAGMLQFQGLNFAIPIEYLKQELFTLYYDDVVVHPWIGAYGHTKKSGRNKVGLEIQYVMPGSSAFLSGLKAGDIITSIQGQKISSLEDYQMVLMAYTNETLINCTYIDSDDFEHEILLYLDKRPENPATEVFSSDFINESFIPLFGMKLVNSSTVNKNSYTITQILAGSVAEELNLSENDPIIVKDVKFDKENKRVVAQIYAQRKKNGFLDVYLLLSCPYDNPYYL